MRSEVCFDDIEVVNTFDVEESDGLELIMKKNIHPRAPYTNPNYSPTTNAYKQEPRKPSELVEKTPSFDDLG
jgi:hypothetical protein